MMASDMISIHSREKRTCDRVRHSVERYFENLTNPNIISNFCHASGVRDARISNLTAEEPIGTTQNLRLTLLI